MHTHTPRTWLTPVPGWLLHWRADGGRLSGAGLLLGLVALAIAPSTTVEVPMRSDVTALVWPLVPLLPAAMLAVSLDLTIRELDATVARPAHSRRLLDLAIPLLAVTTLATWAQYAEPALTVDAGPIIARNALLLYGLALLGWVTLSSAIGWGACVVLAAVTFQAGSGAAGAIAPWAVLYQPAMHVAPWLVAIGLFTAGAISYLAVPIRWLLPRAE